MNLEVSPSKESLPPLTQQEVLKILWKSYEFSQGDPTAQKFLLHKIRGYYEAPAEINAEEIKKIFLERVISYTPSEIRMDVERANHTLAKNKAHAEISVGDIHTEIGYLDRYVDCLTSQESVDINIQDIIKSIWARDYKFLFEDGRSGRPNRNVTKRGSNNLFDSHFSYGVHYILKDNKTGVKVFDMLLDDIKSVPLEEYDPETIRKIQVVVKKYNSTHPNTPVTEDIVQRI